MRNNNKPLPIAHRIGVGRATKLGSNHVMAARFRLLRAVYSSLDSI
jgi:hypothetical protein